MFHLYADDTQLYLSFKPQCQSSVAEMLQSLDECTSNINTWMRSHFLKLNGDKTEVVVITTPTLSKYTISSVDICGSAVCPVKCAKDLGVVFDSSLKMEPHVRAVCKRAFHQIHLIRSVRRYISEDAARTLIRTNVTSLLDYCNCVLTGLPSSLINLLQRVQNCAARVVKCAPRSCSITPILKDLHWLPIKYRIDYKVLLLTFKALNDLAPLYLKDLLQPYQPARVLRSMNDNLLSVPKFKYTTYGGRSFEVIAPRLWNNLPNEMRKITCLATFKNSLKTYLFQAAFSTV